MSLTLTDLTPEQKNHIMDCEYRSARKCDDCRQIAEEYKVAIGWTGKKPAKRWLEMDVYQRIEFIGTLLMLMAATIVLGLFLAAFMGMVM